MSDASQSEGRNRPHSPPVSAAYMEFDLPAEIERLKAEAAWSRGHNAKTLAKYDDLRVVLMTFAADARVPEHHAEGGVTIHVVAGKVDVGAVGRTFRLGAGGVLVLQSGVKHHLHALEESAVLLTIAWRSTK